MGGKKGYTESKEEGEITAATTWFLNPVVFTIICCCSNVFHMAQLSYLGAAISMIEKRFQMRSTQSGLFFAINDVVGLCSVLFITHLGHKRNRPRIIGILYLSFGIGVSISALPHFIYELPLSLRPGVATGFNDSFMEAQAGGHEDGIMCIDQNSLNATCDAEHSSQSGALIHEAWWIFLGQAIAGFITSSGPLAITFIDDNQNRKNTPLFVGILFSSWTVGIVVGFFLANFCLRIPVSFPFIDPATTVLDPTDPRFLGAWWLGIVICGLGIMICSIPMFFFPRHLAGSRLRKSDNQDEEQEEEFIASKITGFGEIKDLVQALKRIITNVAVMAFLLAMCATSNSFVGLRTFGTKYVNTQFGISLSDSAMLTGIIIIPCAIFGSITGGAIVKKLRLQTRGMAMMACLLMTSVVVFGPLYFFVGCEQSPKAGLTVPYSDNNERFLEEQYLPNLSSTCNADCNCQSIYRPVCGSDGVTYSSPCYAGCSEETAASSDGYNQTMWFFREGMYQEIIDECGLAHRDEYVPARQVASGQLAKALVDVCQIFSNCSCLAARNDSLPYALPGECERECDFKFHMLVGLLLSGIGSLALNPIIMLKIRLVEERDRSLVLGFTNVVVKLLGYIPGPVMWGALIDSTCVLFQESCGKTGNCEVYDTDKFRNVYYGTVMVLKVIELACLYTGLKAILYGLRKAKEYNALKVQEPTDGNEAVVSQQEDYINTPV